MRQDISASIQEWAELYKAAIEYRQTEPWQWMDDGDIFGVRNPEDGEIGYCNIVGSLGEFVGLIVHLGTEGLRICLKMLNGEIPPEGEEVLYCQKALSVSFGDRNELAKPDMDLIKKLGIKFKGSGSWPQFRSYLPDYYPWYFNRKEVIFLTLALQQAKTVSLRFKEDPGFFDPPEDSRFFVRVAEAKGNALEWRDAWLSPALLNKPEPDIPVVDELRLRRITKETVRRSGVWEVDFFHMPVPIKEAERPFFPYVFLAVDDATGFVLATRLEGPDRYRSEFQNQMVEVMEDLKAVPAEIRFKNGEVLKLFEPIASKVGFKMTPVEKFKELQRARKSIEKAMLSGKL